MNIYPLFFAKWLFCLILCSFCAIKIAHRVPVTVLQFPAKKSNQITAPEPGIDAKGDDYTQAKTVTKVRENYGANISGMFAGNYTVPVVVHIISQNPYAITDQQIIDSINNLNDAFAHSGVYAIGPGANTGITFCLAKTDPDGGISNGITRTKSVLSDFDADIENDRLKNLVSWDTKQYCNIWYVEGFKSEILTSFSCGVWSRTHEDGYAGLSGDGDSRDGIVTSSLGTLLVHEMGHYLGLKHIFEGGCANNNCTVDGDGVCDTPPQSVKGGSCTAPQNSCSSDTSSGFNVDVPDLNSNFMSYSGTCTNEFTQGQATKMRNILATVRSSLSAQGKCNPPCPENIQAKFTRNNWFPAVGDNINFTSTSAGGSNYEWSVDGTVVGTNSPAYSQSFPVAGKYKITLKVYNANRNCYAAYSDFIIVGCGVMARFYPDKRLIAVKDPALLDTILFTNRSVNAASYKWLMSNDGGMVEQVVSTNSDLNYIFRIPANYTLRLVAINGTCTDTTEKFIFTVRDATADGIINIYKIECYQQTKIKISFNVCNYGYAPIPSNIPVSFYDGDPHTDSANKVGSTFIIPDSIKGQCCGNIYESILDVHETGLNKLYAVFNDNGNTVPVTIPNANLEEKNYENNIVVIDSFQYKVKVSANPATAILEPGDTLQLVAHAEPGSTSSIVWSTAQDLSCTNCPDPVFIAKREDVTKKVIATSGYGCIDSAFVNIKVPPADDYTINIDSINCSRNDSLYCGFTICNNFKRGGVPKSLKVAFYDADPSGTDAHLLGPVFITGADDTRKCVSYSHIIRGIQQGKIFAVVNDNGIKIPVQLSEDSISMEKNYSNNTTSFSYQPDTVSLQPADTTVSPNQPVPILISSPVYNVSSINWIPGDGYTLSCTNCTAPSVTAKANSTIRMEMLNQYGCAIGGEAKIKIIPPDMTLQILQTNCFTNDSLLVRFKICMNNNYDSVLKNVPVAFYDNDPGGGNAKLLEPVFVTTNAMTGNCDTFSAIIKSPDTQNLYGVVNDKGQGSTVFNETSFTNNIDTKKIIPFSVTVSPADTTIFRSAAIQLIATINGGEPGQLKWDPVQYLSCPNCLTPLATPPYSLQFKLEARNEYSCTATGYVDIKTFTSGKVNIPNGFTPNADGRNDVFYILGSEDIRILKDFSIFNRWGQKVFQVVNAPANDPDFGWKGFINGKEADAGTYVYFVKVSFTDGTEQLFKGTVTLIR